MKNIFKYLKSYSDIPLEVDKLIVSAFIEINGLNLINNQLLRQYSISLEKTEIRDKLNKFIEIISGSIADFNIEKLIELFEFVISPSDRIVNGAIYTPSEIREYIVTQTFNRIGNQIDDAKIADISCGCSGFLYTAAKELRTRTGNSFRQIFENQLFGLDIQEYSITRSKLLLSLFALYEGEDAAEFHFNLHQGDALIFEWRNHYENFGGFQIIIGNPPYVCARNLDQFVKENLRNWSVSTSGNPDLYIPFFQIGYENLAQNGILGFITMNSFFKSLNGRSLRSYFAQNNATVRVVDFGTTQIFKSKSTYTCICFLEKLQQDYIEYFKSTQKELPTDLNQYSRIPYRNLNAKKGWNLNNHEIISRIEATGTSFGEKYKTRHGIATLKNDIYIFKPVAEDDDFFYLQNGNLYPIEKGICKDILNSNKLSRNIDFDNVVEKVIFPYNEEKRPKAIEEDSFREKFPRAFEYLQVKKNILAERDKGKGNYEKWYSFGRTQSLERIENKLFFPKFSDRIPSYLISNDNDLLFYNGQAIVGHSDQEMLFVKKILESRLFWYYIKTTSKPYTADYYSLNGTYIKNFGIPDFTQKEIEFLLNENNPSVIDDFLESFYDLKLPL